MRNRDRALAVCSIVGSLLLSSCTPGVETGPSPYEGMWRSEGFGLFLVIEGNDATFYEKTAISCAGFPTGSAQGISDSAELEAGRLRLEDAQRMVYFDPVESLPEGCGDEYFRDDPEWVFAVLAATVEEHYPQLAARDPDWASRRDTLAAGLGPDTPQEDLLAAVLGLLGGLGDAQVRFATGDPELLPGEPWSAAPGNPVVDRLASEMVAGIRLERIEQTAEGSGIVAGRLPGGVGYLGFELLAVPTEDSFQTERIIAGAVDGLLNGLARGEAPGLVLDLRATAGGVEGIALLIASRFLPEATVIGSQQVRVAGTDRLVDAGSFSVTPLATGTYQRPVVVLTGPGTVGAAEWLVLALRPAPNVTVIGEPTFGTLSPLLVRLLPNRWNLGLPNGIVADADGTVWEITGIPPDETVPVEGADLEAGRDPTLERAIELIGG